MRYDIGHLHHVGHIVDDMSEALALYRRLGFVLPSPSYPTMAPRQGAAPVPFGAANTHADFPRSFVELATFVKEGHADRIPSDAKLIPLQAPAELMPRLLERIRNTSASLATYLDRFEGSHILMFSSPDLDAAAMRLSAAGVRHGGVNSVQRPVETKSGVRMESVRYLELDSDEPGTKPGTLAEGRVGVVAALDPEIQSSRRLDHPNGAVDLVEVVLCVARADLTTVQARYENYLGRRARTDGPSRVFDLEGAGLTLVPDSDLATLLPGERPAALPAFVAYTVAVRDISVARDLLRDNGFPLNQTASGDIFVPAAAALGTAIIFRAATTG